MLIQRIKKSISDNGFKTTVQLVAQKLLGIKDWRDELDTLHYFLNAYHDASSAPPATNPDLRLMQLCDVEMLRIFTRECDKKGLTYWLDYGTLLGAVRHKGFIPWDDDMDIAMPRSDYNKVLLELKEVLAQYDIEIHENLGNMGVGYKHYKTGIWLDVFAVDDFFYSDDLKDPTNHLNTTIPIFRKEFYRHKSEATIEWKEKKRKEIIGGITGEKRVLYHQPEFDYKVITHPEEIVFPLSEVFFEGYYFNAPNNLDSYLKVNYGNSYMSFPRTGVLHHGLGRGPLYSWAKKNDIDMNEVFLYLKSL